MPRSEDILVDKYRRQYNALRWDTRGLSTKDKTLESKISFLKDKGRDSQNVWNFLQVSN